MVNNYTKVSHYTRTASGRPSVSSELFPFDDRDTSATARALAGAIALAQDTGGVVSVFRRVDGCEDIPVVGRGGGF